MEDARVRHDVSPIPMAHQLAVLALIQHLSLALRRHTEFYSIADPFPCRYTGYIRGMGETFAKTPVMAQWETKEPSPDSFLYARSKVCTALNNVCHLISRTVGVCSMWHILWTCRRHLKPRQSMRRGTPAARRRRTASLHITMCCGPGTPPGTKQRERLGMSAMSSTNSRHKQRTAPNT